MNRLSTQIDNQPPVRPVGASLSRLLFIAFAAMSPLATWACVDDEPETIQAPLVAPPNVPPKADRGTAHVIVDLEAREEVREIAPGVEYEVWSFNSFVPGPIIRVQVGDTVEVRLRNDASSRVAHNIDLHAVNGPGGGAEATNVAPGETKSFTFKALAPGLFTYHCAQGIVADHISNGMYGGILVERPRGRALYDREYYLGQHEYFLTGDNGPNGIPELDVDAMLAEQPTYVVWNGTTDAVTGEDALHAETGETVRLYVSNGGPNYTSSFHVIGEIFDRAYQWGSLANAPVRDIQTISVPPGGSVITDLTINVPGDYKIVDHALGRVSKGAVAILTATGDDDFEIFRDLQANPRGADEEPEPSDGDGDDDGAGGTGMVEELDVQMDDNFFVPDELTVQAGSSVMFRLDNVGVLPHNLHVADADGSYDNDAASDLINGGQASEFRWDAPGAPGTYLFRCDVPPVDMTGTITVQ